MSASRYQSSCQRFQPKLMQICMSLESVFRYNHARIVSEAFVRESEAWRVRLIGTLHALQVQLKWNFRGQSRSLSMRQAAQ